MSFLMSSNDNSALLLEEFNHRLANTLQLLCATLNRCVDDSLEFEAMRLNVVNFRNRVDLLARIHRSVSLGPGPLVRLEDHVRELLSDLVRAFGRKDVVLKVTIADAPLSADKRLKFVLLVLELVTNALRHGPSGIKQHIDVDLAPARPGMLRLLIRNNGGASAPPSNMPPRVASKLSDSLDGAIFISAATDPGFTAKVDFPSDVRGSNGERGRVSNTARSLRR